MTTTTHSAATLRAVLSRSLPTPSFVAAVAAAVVGVVVVAADAAAADAADAAVIFHFISIINTVMIAFIPAI